MCLQWSKKIKEWNVTLRNQLINAQSAKNNQARNRERHRNFTCSSVLDPLPPFLYPHFHPTLLSHWSQQLTVQMSAIDLSRPVPSEEGWDSNGAKKRGQRIRVCAYPTMQLNTFTTHICFHSILNKEKSKVTSVMCTMYFNQYGLYHQLLFYVERPVVTEV